MDANEKLAFASVAVAGLAEAVGWHHSRLADWGGACRVGRPAMMRRSGNGFFGNPFPWAPRRLALGVAPARYWWAPAVSRAPRFFVTRDGGRRVSDFRYGLARRPPVSQGIPERNIVVRHFSRLIWIDFRYLRQQKGMV